LNKVEIELEIVKYIAGSDSPLISINRLIQFVLNKRVEYIENNRAVPVRDVAVGKLHPDGYVVYSMEDGEN